MIRKIKANLYIADKQDLCGEEIIFIREDENVLHHICMREKGKWKTEEYLVGLVRFDYTSGQYFCERRDCNAKFELADVWSDLAGGTGYESKC